MIVMSRFVPLPIRRGRFAHALQPLHHGLQRNSGFSQRRQPDENVRVYGGRTRDRDG